MPTFEYKALDESGNSRTGMVDADTARDARARLRRDKLHIMEIRESVSLAEPTAAPAGSKSEESKPRRKAFSLPFGRITSDQIAIFTRQLATLLRAGIPLAQSLRALIEQSIDPKVNRILRDVHERVTQGKNMSEAMESHPRMFSPLYCSMVRAGEATGGMDIILTRLANYIQEQTRLQNKIRAALTYPVVMVFVGIIVVFVLMRFVVPKITDLLESNRQALPLSTKMLIKTSHFIGSWWWAMALAAILIFVTYKLIHRTPKGGLRLDTWKLKMPIVGSLLSKVSISRFAVTMSILLKSGIPALQALRVVKGIVDNRRMSEVIQDIHDSIIEGTDITSPLKKSGVFPPMVAYMIAVGEKSGQLEEILDQIAISYDEEVDFATQQMVSLLEPIMIVSLAVVVGFIVMSVMVPILKLSQMK